MPLPVKIAAVDDRAADTGSMTADIFRRGIDNNRGTVLERSRDQRRRGVVTISGTPSERPMSATSLIGNTLSFGFGSVSAK